MKKFRRLSPGTVSENMNKKRFDTRFESRVSEHFLFNALNAVASLCRTNPEAAAELLEELSIYLQKSLEEKTFLIAWNEELEHLLSYINVQKIRFTGRLEISLNIDDNIQGLIPPFTLQPVVDNAIRHGVLKQKNGGTVSISAQKSVAGLRIMVEDDGVGMTGEQIAGLFEKGNQKHALYRVNHLLKRAGFPGLTVNSVRGERTVVIINL